MKKISKVFVHFTAAIVAFIFLVRIIQGCISEAKNTHKIAISPTQKKYESLYYILAQRDTIQMQILGDKYQEDAFHQIFPSDTINNLP